MILKEKPIKEKLVKLSSHYHLFYNNQFIKYYLLDAKISKNIWIDIECLMNSVNDFETSGCELENLYEQISSFVTFITVMQNEVIPKMLNEENLQAKKSSSTSKVLYRMSLKNLPENIRILLNMINELYNTVKGIDISMNGEDNALYINLPYVKKIDDNLNSRLS